MKKKLLVLTLAAAFILGFSFPSTTSSTDSEVCSIGYVLNEF